MCKWNFVTLSVQILLIKIYGSLELIWLICAYLNQISYKCWRFLRRSLTISNVVYSNQLCTFSDSNSFDHFQLSSFHIKFVSQFLLLLFTVEWVCWACYISTLKLILRNFFFVLTNGEKKLTGENFDNFLRFCFENNNARTSENNVRTRRIGGRIIFCSLLINLKSTLETSATRTDAGKFNFTSIFPPAAGGDEVKWETKSTESAEKSFISRILWELNVNGDSKTK